MFFSTQYRQLVIPVIVFFAVLFVPLLSVAEESSQPEFTRSVVNYTLPDLTVIRQDGKKLSFSKELDDSRPVILNFIFASCSAICPMLSHVLSKVRTKLAKEGQKVHLVSISIDPENDTPAKLIEYSKKFGGAVAGWDYYTGTMKDSIAIQKAFDVYRGDKMNHSSVIFMRAKPDKSWLRLEGFASPDAVVHEYHDMIKQK